MGQRRGRFKRLDPVPGGDRFVGSAAESFDRLSLASAQAGDCGTQEPS
jgi:hypothetical protein